MHLIVGFAAGGPADISARLIGQWLSERSGQSFVIENRPGASSNLATEMVVRARPDGYTLLQATAANAWNATLYDNLSFNFIRDIMPVAGVTRQGGVMVVNPSLPTKTASEINYVSKCTYGQPMRDAAVKCGGWSRGCWKGDIATRPLLCPSLRTRCPSIQTGCWNAAKACGNIPESMPRRSAASLAITPVALTGPTRLAPPESLPEPARTVFIDIALAVKPEHFAPCDLPLLCRYAEASVLAERAAAAALDGNAAALSAWSTATRMQSLLAMRLRLSPQARQPNRPNRPLAVSYYDRMRLEVRDDAES